MAKGYALTIGLNSVDPNHYSGWSGPLNACEADAEDMAALASSRGFQVETILTRKATRDAVRTRLEQIAERCSESDIFMLTYCHYEDLIAFSFVKAPVIHSNTEFPMLINAFNLLMPQ